MTIISKYFQSAHCNPLRCADCETIGATIGAIIIFIADERNNAFGSWHRTAKPQLVDFVGAHHKMIEDQST
jgi:hypothetical protein